MKNSNGDPTPPDDLPEEVVQRIDTMGVPELKSLSSYLDQLLDAKRTSIEEDIEANAEGEVLDIEPHGETAIVRQHPPDPDGADVNMAITALYHVRREQQIDGTESLHWVYLGDVQDSDQRRCGSCGGTLGGDVDICPHCGSEDVTHTGSTE